MVRLQHVEKIKEENCKTETIKVPIEKQKVVAKRVKVPKMKGKYVDINQAEQEVGIGKALKVIILKIDSKIMMIT